VTNPQQHFKRRIYGLCLLSHPSTYPIRMSGAEEHMNSQDLNTGNVFKQGNSVNNQHLFRTSRVETYCQLCARHEPMKGMQFVSDVLRIIILSILNEFRVNILLGFYLEFFKNLIFARLAKNNGTYYLTPFLKPNRELRFSQRYSRRCKPSGMLLTVDVSEDLIDFIFRSKEPRQFLDCLTTKVEQYSY